MGEVPEFILGRQGGEQMTFAGFCYSKNRVRKNSVLWECCERSCRAIAVTASHHTKIRLQMLCNMHSIVGTTAVVLIDCD